MFNLEITNCLEINIEAENHKLIRRHFYSFLYINQDLKSTVKVFKKISEESYIIKGSKKIQELKLIDL